MRQINIGEAKSHLSKLVDQAAQGESFVIARGGKPLVKVVALERADISPASRLGFLAGEIVVPDDFDAIGREEVERLFGSVP